MSSDFQADLDRLMQAKVECEQNPQRLAAIQAEISARLAAEGLIDADDAGNGLAATLVAFEADPVDQIQPSIASNEPPSQYYPSQPIRRAEPAATFHSDQPPSFNCTFLNTNNMERLTKEARMNLAIQAKKRDPKLSYATLSSTYDVAHSTLRARYTGTPHSDYIVKSRELTPTQEKSIVDHILDLDTRAFPVWFQHVEDMANYQERLQRLLLSAH